MRQVALWPLREVLLAYLEKMRDATAHNYETALQVWAAKTAFGGGAKPPVIPPLLRT
jgi:hypothetical protein